MPPRVARDEVATSGANISPSRARNRLSRSSTTPGPTSIVPASRSRVPIARRWAETSMTRPSPTAPPARPVPAPRGVTPIATSAAALTTAEH